VNRCCPSSAAVQLCGRCCKISTSSRGIETPVPFQLTEASALPTLKAGVGHIRKNMEMDGFIVGHHSMGSEMS